DLERGLREGPGNVTRERGHAGVPPGSPVGRARRHYGRRRPRVGSRARPLHPCSGTAPGPDRLRDRGSGRGGAEMIVLRIAKRIVLVAAFVLYFLKEVVVANLRVAWEVITIHRHMMHPGIAAIPLEARTDIEIALLANLITLTPGTLSVDVSSDRKVLYVHE